MSRAPRRQWLIGVGQRSRVMVTARTLGAACRQAFRKLGLKAQPHRTRDGGWEGVDVAVLADPAAA
jgi:hypothetical protein